MSCQAVVVVAAGVASGTTTAEAADAATGAATTASEHYDETETAIITTTTTNNNNNNNNNISSQTFYCRYCQWWQFQGVAKAKGFAYVSRFDVSMEIGKINILIGFAYVFCLEKNVCMRAMKRRTEKSRQWTISHHGYSTQCLFDT
jgi:hypothetical protein